jgi:hypothetical protein
MMPWYNGEEATRHLRAVIGPHYHRSNNYVFSVLWYNYNFCQFVEDDGESRLLASFVAAPEIFRRCRFLSESGGAVNF